MEHVLRSRAPSGAAARLAGLVATLLAVPALAQDAPFQGPGEGAAAQGRQALGTGGPAELARPDDRPGTLVEGGEVRFVPLEGLPDVPRRPQGRVGRDGEERDELVAEASGDPYFLGFAAGPYAPPAAERIDPLLAGALESLAAAPRSHGEIYGFVMFAKRITEGRVAELERLGLRVLDYHPSNCLRVAIPPAAIDALAGLEFVRWVGVARPWQKVHPMLTTVLERDGSELLEVTVSVFESDLNPDSVRTPFGEAQLVSPLGGVEPAPEALSDGFGRWTSRGWQQSALEALGLEIELFSPRSNSFRARLPRAALDALLTLDFVQFVEPWIAPTQAHDESMPMIQADLTRTSWGGGSTGTVVVGEADSGIDTGHSGLNHIFGWGWDLASSGSGAWSDGNGHGSHVAGTILGKADADRSLDGVAPGLGGSSSLRVFNTKIFNDSGSWGGATMSDILTRFESNLTDGGGNTTPRPHTINHSWGTVGSNWIGTEADCRELDNSVWSHGQLHVFAAGNEGPTGSRIRLQPSAKNVFSVGNVLDYYLAAEGYPGTIYSRSSPGPTGDLRWRPNVSAPGRWIDSVAAGTGTGYVQFWGTSMAAPHVTGLAAQLMDHYSFLQYRPATLGAVLMATALTKDGVTLSAPGTSSTSHYNLYGTGRIDAFRAHNLAGQQLYFWNFNMTSSSGHAELDIAIPSNATRVAFVLLYHERAASAGASSALVNDLDMYIDREPFSSSGNSGTYFAHQSARDNAEVRILNNPAAGNWRIKIYPEHIPNTLLNTVRVGVAAVVTLSNTSPTATLTTTLDKTYVKPLETVQMTANVSNPSYVAAMVQLASSHPGGTLLAAETTLKDGPVADLMNNPHTGTRATLGNIRSGQSRSVRWRARWASEGTKTWTVTMQSENAGTPSSAKSVVVDGTPPQGPAILTSSHPVGSYRCNLYVEMSWSPATDNLSGVAGYRVAFNQLASTELSTTINLAPTTSYAQTLPPSSSPHYFHIRAVDRSGNGGPTQSYGPIYIGGPTAIDYCTTTPNSVGPGATIGSTGSLSISANNLQLTSSGLPSDQFSLFFVGTTAVSVPFGNGFLCASGTIVRLNVVSTGGGSVSLPLNLGAGSPLGVVSPGQSYYFQNWYRDPAAGGAGFNFSHGRQLRFCE